MRRWRARPPGVVAEQVAEPDLDASTDEPADRAGWEASLLAEAAATLRSRLDVRTIVYEPLPYWCDLPVLRGDGSVHFPGTSIPLDGDVLARYGVEVPLALGERRIGRLVIRLRATASADRNERVWIAAVVDALAASLARTEAATSRPGQDQRG